jgi:predicted ABC-class ATPase
MKSIVIDASVARAAGETSQFPVSKQSREFLEAVLKSNHKIVLNKQLFQEWEKHESKYALRIRVALASKGRIVFKKNTENDSLRQLIQNSTVDKSRIKPMIKDIHLIEAALLTDRIVISNDNKVRNHFNSVSDKVHYLKLIIWINPTIMEEEAVKWLLDGALEEESRKIGSNFQQPIKV